MAIVTKFKIYKSGKMQAGHFVEDSDKVSLKMNSFAHVKELDEFGDSVKIMSDGTLVAKEFEEI